MQSTVFRRKFRGASPYKGDLEDMGKVSAFLKRKNVLFSAKRYGIDAMGAMAQGLFASLLIGTIIKTLGQQLNVQFLIDAGNFAQQVAGPAMAVSIGAALSAPQLVLYSLIAVGMAANKLGGAGGPLAVYFITIVASECGKIVSKETKVDILVTPAVTILVGVGLSVLCAPAIGAAASSVGDFIKWATNLQPLLMGILVSVVVGMALTLPISSAAICAALSLTGLAGAQRLRAAARRWLASRSCPSARTAWAAWSVRGWARRCCKCPTSSAIRACGFPRRLLPPSPARLRRACSTSK